MSNFIPNSFQVPNAVIDDYLSRLSGNAFKCYALICRQTTGWQKQSDRISISQFMNRCGIKDKRTAQNAIAELENVKLIVVFRKNGEISEFMLNFNPEIQPVAKNDTGSKNCIEPVAKNDTGTGYKNCTSTKDTIKNTITNKKTTQKNTALALLAEFGIEGELAEDFIIHRKSFKGGAEITRTVLNRIKTQAELANLPLSEVLAMMIERGWRGFKASWDWQQKQSKSTKPQYADDGSWAKDAVVTVDEFGRVSVW